MTSPALSILLFVDVEKGSEYLDHYLGSLREWNADGLDDTQVLVISQHEDSAGVRATCAAQPFPVEVVEAIHPRVNGYPVWDVLEEIRQAWPMVRGRYITTAHTEFLWCPGRLRKTIDHLERRKPYLALGNLRRPWKVGGNPRGSEEVSKQLTAHLDRGNWDAGCSVAETLPTWHWIYWFPKAPAPGKTAWLEEVFFADREWFDAVKLAHHGGRLPFQDIYDLMGRAMQWLEKSKLSPEIERLPLEAHKAIHIWHGRAWASWTNEMSNYFLSDKLQWGQTPLGNPALWRELLRSGEPTGKMIADLRISRGGTVTRYGNAMQSWLQNGGAPALKSFYAAHGQARRER